MTQSHSFIIMAAAEAVAGAYSGSGLCLSPEEMIACSCVHSTAQPLGNLM